MCRWACLIDPASRLVIRSGLRRKQKARAGPPCVPCDLAILFRLASLMFSCPHCSDCILSMCLYVWMCKMTPTSLRLASFLFASRLCIPLLAQNLSFDVFDYVDQLIGTENGGHGRSINLGYLRSSIDVDQHVNQSLPELPCVRASSDFIRTLTDSIQAYSMAKAVADVDGDNTGGFASDNSNVTGTFGTVSLAASKRLTRDIGFSHMHDRSEVSSQSASSGS